MAQRLVELSHSLLRDDARLARADRRLNGLESWAAGVHSLAGSITLALALLSSAWLVEQEKIGVPGAVLIVLMALAALEPFTALRRGALEAGRTWLAARRLVQPLAQSDYQPPKRLRPATGLAI